MNLYIKTLGKKTSSSWITILMEDVCWSFWHHLSQSQKEGLYHMPRSELRSKQVHMMESTGDMQMEKGDSSSKERS